MKNIFPYFALFLGLFLIGCDSTANDEGTAMVMLNLQPVVNGTGLSTDQSKTYDLNGTAVSFSSARLYVSEIALLREDGTSVTFEADLVTVPAKDDNGNDITHTVTDLILLAKHDAGQHEYSLGTVPEGRYTGIRYTVGIAGTNNRVDASQVPAGHPLAKQTDRNNHWNWSAGYMFIRMDGEVDTNADGIPDEVWEVHLGTPNFLTDIQLAQDFELNDGETTELHLMIDYAHLLEDVDLTSPDERLCHTADNLPVANKVGARIGDAFMFHGVHLAEHDQN